MKHLLLALSLATFGFAETASAQPRQVGKGVYQAPSVNGGYLRGNNGPYSGYSSYGNYAGYGGYGFGGYGGQNYSFTPGLNPGFGGYPNPYLGTSPFGYPGYGGFGVYGRPW